MKVTKENVHQLIKEHNLVIRWLSSDDVNNWFLIEGIPVPEPIRGKSMCLCKRTYPSITPHISWQYSRDNFAPSIEESVQSYIDKLS